jgi:hypothetical protein
LWPRQRRSARRRAHRCHHGPLQERNQDNYNKAGGPVETRSRGTQTVTWSGSSVAVYDQYARKSVVTHPYVEGPLRPSLNADHLQRRGRRFGPSDCRRRDRPRRQATVLIGRHGHLLSADNYDERGRNQTDVSPSGRLPITSTTASIATQPSLAIPSPSAG